MLNLGKKRCEEYIVIFGTIVNKKCKQFNFNIKVKQDRCLIADYISHRALLFVSSYYIKPSMNRIHQLIKECNWHINLLHDDKMIERLRLFRQSNPTGKSPNRQLPCNKNSRKQKGISRAPY